ncbi:hypothetical protein Hanom_Chr15g01370201 [Helianthus anomalus]
MCHDMRAWKMMWHHLRHSRNWFWLQNFGSFFLQMGIHGIRILTRVYIVSKIFFSFKSTTELFSLSSLSKPSAAMSEVEVA